MSCPTAVRRIMPPPRQHATCVCRFTGVDNAQDGKMTTTDTLVKPKESAYATASNVSHAFLKKRNPRRGTCEGSTKTLTIMCAHPGKRVLGIVRVACSGCSCAI